MPVSRKKGFPPYITALWNNNPPLIFDLLPLYLLLDDDKRKIQLDRLLLTVPEK
jgi:hypothetical protein